jgi:succinate dehydrogenase / fumarate reductase iron-sulfur subunit
MSIVKFKIERTDRRGGGGSHQFYQAYDVSVVEGMTVLEALRQIRERRDGTLAFRCSCRSAICGSCAMMINGFPKLACKIQVLPEYKKRGEIVVEPLTNHTVIKDLVVDFDPFWKKMERITPYLTSNDKGEGERQRLTKEDTAAIDSAQKCIMCGSCNAACNALEIDKYYLAPAALAKAWRFVGDAREKNRKKRIMKLSDEHGMWDCVRCVHCTEYCPKDVAPLQAIERLRAEAMRVGVTDNHGAKHVESMVNSVKRIGRLDEAAMTFKTLGFLRSIGKIPLGLKMQIHGKMPMPIIFPVIEGIKEVKTIYKEVEKGRKEKKKREKKG